MIINICTISQIRVASIKLILRIASHVISSRIGRLSIVIIIHLLWDIIWRSLVIIIIVIIGNGASVRQRRLGFDFLGRHAYYLYVFTIWWHLYLFLVELRLKYIFSSLFSKSIVYLDDRNISNNKDISISKNLDYVLLLMGFFVNKEKVNMYAFCVFILVFNCMKIINKIRMAMMIMMKRWTELLV